MGEKPEVGDKVRVTYEGEVDWAGTNTFQLTTGRMFDLSNATDRIVEIVEKKKPKVGDVIRPKHYPNLPNHTVILHSDKINSLVKVEGKWHYPDKVYGFDDIAPSWDDFTIEYLPGK
jgi:hypothetical protein